MTPSKTNYFLNRRCTVESQISRQKEITHQTYQITGRISYVDINIYL